jgi:hypothetical protein
MTPEYFVDAEHDPEDPIEDGSRQHPFRSIKRAVDKLKLRSYTEVTHYEGGGTTRQDWMVIPKMDSPQRGSESTT